ncbi:hypothetical protein AVEN_199961-1 [Araneus ventricosus]|uniref:Uncharacterized protein n=1 Tax=Araneus ventricosus TaxID=182803 RepID=A0A4Y2BX02_ARAVE|nr:hypothetical protein AVEN_199961-1 [Araneus ventricosus]
MAQSITDFTISDSNEKNPLHPQSTSNYESIDSAPPNFTEQKVDTENNVELEEPKQSPEHSTKASLSEDLSHITISSSESNSVSINICSTETESSSNEQDCTSDSQEVDSVLIENIQDSSKKNVVNNTENDILNENSATCETSEENSSSEDLSVTPEGNSSSEPVTPDHQKNWDEERQK